METFRVNSKTKNWDANHHPWEKIDTGFLSTHTRYISGKYRVQFTSIAQLSTYIKYFIRWNGNKKYPKLIILMSLSQIKVVLSLKMPIENFI